MARSAASVTQLLAGRGTQWAPSVVDALITILDEHEHLGVLRTSSAETGIAAR